MTISSSPICLTCERLWSFPYCDAFGDQPIPMDIIVNRFDHHDPHPGDHGLQYQPTEAPLAPWTTRQRPLLTHGEG